MAQFLLMVFLLRNCAIVYFGTKQNQSLISRKKLSKTDVTFKKKVDLNCI